MPSPGFAQVFAVWLTGSAALRRREHPVLREHGRHGGAGQRPLPLLRRRRLQRVHRAWEMRGGRLRLRGWLQRGALRAVPQRRAVRAAAAAASATAVLDAGTARGRDEERQRRVLRRAGNRGLRRDPERGPRAELELLSRKQPRDCWYLGCTLPRIPNHVARAGLRGADATSTPRLRGAARDDARACADQDDGRSGEHDMHGDAADGRRRGPLSEGRFLGGIGCATVSRMSQNKALGCAFKNSPSPLRLFRPSVKGALPQLPQRVQHLDLKLRALQLAFVHGHPVEVQHQLVR